MKVAFVNYKTLKENIDFRYEAEFWLPKYLEQEKRLGLIKTVNLENCATFSNGFAFDSKEFSSVGEISISKIGDVTQKRDHKLWECVSKEYFERLNAKFLKHNDILMTLTGDPPDVGKVQLIFNPPIDQLSWNQRVALLRLKRNDEIKTAEYLFITLSNKYCRDYIERWAKGIRQRNVGNPAVKEMLIPIFKTAFQNYITKITKTSFQLLGISKVKYIESEQFLLSELNLTKWKPSQKLSFIKNYSNTEEGERIDAEYYQPKYDDLVNIIKEYSSGYDSLESLVNIEDANFTPESDISYKYIELANIGNNGEVTGFTNAIGSELPTRARRKVSSNDIIISSLEGSLESIALIEDSLNGALCSTGFYVINSEFYNSETLLVLLKSIVGRLQLKKGCSGTILTAINKGEFSKITLPKFEDDIQIIIKSKISEMYESRGQSKKLIEIAKRGVEIAIEKDETTAENWINGKIEKLGIYIDQ